MRNNKRFFVKLLGVLTMQTQNLTEKFILKLLFGVGFLLILLVLSWQLPDIILAIKA